MPDLSPPKSDESEIIGNWLVAKGKVEGDEAERRVKYLTEHYLERLGRDWSGWDTLYRDPSDGRLWEKLYLQGEMHGGGPISLKLISAEEASKKYPHLFTNDGLPKSDNPKTPIKE